MKALFAVFIGSGFGALLRWWLGLALNHWFPAIPPGTVVANWLGAYIIGVAMAVLASNTSLAPEWRLLIITGFCGGLTTFSTFSAELVTLLKAGQSITALWAVATHLGGSLLMTLAGLASVAWWRG